MRTLTLISALAVLVAAPLSAQTLTGLVVEEGGRAPVDGAMVILFDRAGQTVARVLTDGVGRFVVETDVPGPYVLRVDRIGYESLSTGTVEAGADGRFRTIEVPVRAIELAGLDVSGSRRCEVRPSEGRATAKLWEEARKALAATAWTLEEGVYRYTLMHYTRDLDENANRVTSEKRDFIRGRSQTPYVSLPAEQLVEEGFVHTLEDGRGSYYAPDAAVLLSDPFLDTHCMRIKDGRDGMVGLELEPVSGRRLPDIEGTLWLDRSTGQLDRLEYRYVNMRGSARVNGEPGGEVVFGGLPNGTWVVREWRIRMPLIAIQADSRRLFRIGYRDEGGVVWRVIDTDGTIVLEATTATVTGLVTDSTGTGAVFGAVVRAATGEEATTEEDGSFLLSGLAEGLHEITLHHPSLDTLGLASAPHEVLTELGGVSSTRLRLPSPTQAVTQACGGEPRPAATAALLGRIVDRAGTPQADARVTVTPLTERWGAYDLPTRAAPEQAGLEPMTWSDAGNGRSALWTLTDQRGIFLLCDLPTPAQLRVVATHPDAGEGHTTANLGRSKDVAFLTVVVEGAPR